MTNNPKPAETNGGAGLTLRLCGPRGFCAGVERAIQIVVLALKKYGPPVYVRHEIVHNRFVVEGLEARGAVFVKELDEIPVTTKPVVFSAHGVPRSVPEHARALNLNYLDATCPLVSKVHKQALRHLRNNRHILLIGHAGHPEVIGTMGQMPADSVSLIESIADIAEFVPPPDVGLGYVTQTTLSVDDTAEIIAALKRRFPGLTAPAADSICYATTNRQDAVKAAAQGADHFLVVGAPNSSNSRRLVEVALRAGAARAALVQSPGEIPWREIAEAKIIGLSAGASAPEILVDQIVEAIAERFALTIELAETATETEMFPVMRELRDVRLRKADMSFVTG
jgi:4-hydroxy-3-methylbut-2-en-1-yl diphosphate reductase